MLNGIWENISAAIGDVLYNLFRILFVVIDIAQNLFRGFAGIGEIWYGNEFISGGYSQNVADPKSGGILYYILQQDLVKDMIISIALLGLFLIIIFTVMAFIKNVYSAKQKKWQDIIGSSIKGLASFIVVPVMCMLGIWLSNILLVAIDGATRYGGNFSVSGTLFISAAYDANKVRDIDPSVGVTDDVIKVMKRQNIQFDESHDRKDIDYFADQIDKTYSDRISWTKATDVGTFYRTIDVNYLFLGVAGFFIIQPLVTIAFAMARRLFILVMLFVISPGVAALYPLDEGAALGNWKKQFIQTTIGAYGAVAGMNLFFSLYPLFDQIQWGAAFLVAPIVRLFVLIVGLNLVTEFVGIISSYVGGENALDKGKSVRSAAKESFKKHVAGSVAGVTGAFAKAKGARDAGGRWFSNLTTSAMDSTLKTFGIDRKSIRESYKSGIEHPDQWREDAVNNYNNRRSTEQFQANRGAAQNIIDTAREAERDLTNQEMADVLRPIQDKEAKRRVASMFANYRNQYARNNGRGTTTIDKVLESETKVVQEQSRRQSAYGANTDYTASVTSYSNADTALTNYTATPTLSDGTPIGYNVDTGETGLTRVADERVEQLKLDAQNNPGDVARQTAYSLAIETNRVIAEFKEKYKERKAAFKELKQNASNLATQLESLAENYSGENKNTLTTQANAIKEVINDPASTAVDVTTAVTDARNALTAEMQNILNSGTIS